jgi:uncharacterized membrane protein
VATLNPLMGLASTVIGLIGGVILVYGVAVGFARWVRTEGWYWSGRDPREERLALRHLLTFHLLLSLEFLIAADIIATIREPGLEELAILGGTLAIRTVISFTLNWELRAEAD